MRAAGRPFPGSQFQERARLHFLGEQQRRQALPRKRLSGLQVVGEGDTSPFAREAFGTITGVRDILDLELEGAESLGSRPGAPYLGIALDLSAAMERAGRPARTSRLTAPATRPASPPLLPAKSFLRFSRLASPAAPSG